MKSNPPLVIPGSRKSAAGMAPACDSNFKIDELAAAVGATARFGIRIASVGAVLYARNERRSEARLWTPGDSNRHRGIFVPLVRLEDHPPDFLFFRPRTRQRFSGAR
jgi:hypothetical protein